MSVKNDNCGQFRCWLLHFSFAKNKFYITYPLVSSSFMLRRLISFSLLVKLNRRIHSVSRFSLVLFLKDWIECFTESLDFSTKLRFNTVSVFLLRFFFCERDSSDFAAWLSTASKTSCFLASMITIILSTQDFTWHFTSVFGLKLLCFFG